MYEQVEDPQLLNGLALAYIGDAVYELAIRKHLLSQGMTKPNALHHQATHYVSAKAQAYLIDKMAEIELLDDEELKIFKRGRNANSHTKAKNTDRATYNQSSGFEAIFGYIYLKNNTKRLQDLTSWCIDTIEKREA